MSTLLEVKNLVTRFYTQEGICPCCEWDFLHA